MVKITVELTNESLQNLEKLALKLGISIEDLARIRVEDILNKPDEEFQKIAKYVLEKNAELYKRLAK